LTTSAAIVVGTPASPAFPATSPSNGAAKVSWLAATSPASPLTGYVVTPYIGTVAQTPVTFTSIATSQMITGLTNGTDYTFRIAGINAYGVGPYSTTAIVTVGAPLAPTKVTATPGTGNVILSWVPGADNGSSITGYIIRPFIGSTAQPVTVIPFATSSITLYGYPSGGTYTFKVTPVNANGTGVTSSATAAVTIL